MFHYLPEKVLQFSTTETPADACGVGKKSRYDDVYKAIADELARRGIQDLASVPSARVFLSGIGIDQDTLGGGTGYRLVKFTDRLNHKAGKIEV